MRIDIESFDYHSFAMGQTGLAQERLDSQAAFILSYLGENRRALEIGCAGGDLAGELRRRRTFASYDGIELSPAGARAAEKLDQVFVKPLGELLDSGEIQGNSYDIVLSSHCLEHIENPCGMVETITGAMKPGSLLFIETPNRSGHPSLPFDDNRAHLHFFCATSLTRILARCGLETLVLQTGARHDARYPDCLRVMARLTGFAPDSDASILSGAAELEGVDQLVVWGAGRMVEEILAHYFDPARIAFFVDKDVRKHGQTRLGKLVYGSDILNSGSDWCVLVNSLEMETSIREEISTAFGGRVRRVIGIAELLDHLPRPRKSCASDQGRDQTRPN